MRSHDYFLRLRRKYRTNGGMHVTFSSQGHGHEAFVILFRRVEVAKSRLHTYNVGSRGDELVRVGCVSGVVFACVFAVLRPCSLCCVPDIDFCS